jgi:formylmethanofuran dehydrogenase subunit E
VSSKLVSCSKCLKVVRPKQTVVIEHKRVCHDCKKQEAKAINFSKKAPYMDLDD